MKDIAKIIAGVRKKVGKLTIEWHEDLNPFQLLIGTVLSQRTKDVNTDKATSQLFSKFRTPEQLAKADLREIMKLIKPSGFYKTKARYIKKISKIIVEKYNGKIPANRELLMGLPGVGAKTSGIIMVYGFGKPSAIPVDVHVHRISNRIGLVKTKKPEDTEIELMKFVPKKNWIELNELFVLFGQNVCIARNPHCWECPITRYCDYYRNIYSKKN